MARDSGRPRRGRRRPPKREVSCGLALPAAAVRTTLVLAQLVAVRWQIAAAYAARHSHGGGR